jgi:hypothetical protein
MTHLDASASLAKLEAAKKAARLFRNSKPAAAEPDTEVTLLAAALDNIGVPSEAAPKEAAPEEVVAPVKAAPKKKAAPKEKPPATKPARPVFRPVAPKPRAPGVEPHDGYEPLGYIQTTSVLYSYGRRSIEFIKPGDMNKRVLQAICGTQWLWDNCCDEDEIGNRKLNIERLGDSIIDRCQAAGKYNPGRTLGAGVYEVKVDGKPTLVCNSGPNLFDVDGNRVPRILDGLVFDERSNMGMHPDIKSATVAELEELSEVLASWNWSKATAHMLLLGWVGLSAMPGVLDRRPGMFITGPRAAGKSVLMDTICRLLGGSVLKFEGTDSTIAGMRQSLGHDRRSVQIDELGDNAEDSQRHAERTKAFITAFRNAYSESTGEGTLKGTVDGRGNTYSSVYSLLLSGIVVPQMAPADLSRMLICSVKALPTDGELPALLEDLDRLAAIGCRIRMRMFRLWPELKASIAAVRRVMRSRGSTARAADTVGTLAASWYVLMHGIEANAATAAHLVTLLDLDSYAQVLTGTSDERECADVLLGYRDNNMSESIGDLLARALAGKKEGYLALEQHGIKLYTDKTTCIDYAQVCANKNFGGIRAVFDKSKFANGGWASVLARVPGAGETHPQFSGTKTRAIAVPVTWLLDQSSAKGDPEQVKLEPV